MGWIDFGASEGAITITDLALSGYAWSETTGWISLNCSNTSSCGTVDYKVSNNGEGTLSGYAYGENIGWVQFAPTGGGVTIDSSGDFSGYAWGENTGWIVFNCSTTSSCGTVSYKVNTDWRPASARPACNNSSDDDSDGQIDYPSDTGCESLTDTNETNPTPASSSSGGSSSGSRSGGSSFIQPVISTATDGINNVVDFIIPDFFQNKPEVTSTVEPTQEESVSFDNSWDYLDPLLVKNFILAPLPSQLAVFIQKYPDLGKVFTKLGVNTIADLDKLEGAAIFLPTIANLKDLPSEVVIAKGGAGNVHVASTITLDDTGKVEQKIQITSNTALTLAVKPSHPVDGVTGYLIFRESAPRTVSELPLNLQVASTILALGTASSKTPTIPDRELLVQTFSYEDSNNDGIYTADIKTPAVEGTYEVITLIKYSDKTLGSKELRLVTVVDPEGYVYELSSNGKKIRLDNVHVLIFDADANTLWDAITYNQTNPQITDDTGKYSFLVPEGKYYIRAEAKGYKPYTSDTFEVRAGNGVHFNIELHGSGWFAKLDWQTAFFLLVILIISSAFAGYAVHEHMLKRKLMGRT